MEACPWGCFPAPSQFSGSFCCCWNWCTAGNACSPCHLTGNHWDVVRWVCLKPTHLVFLLSSHRIFIRAVLYILTPKFLLRVWIIIAFLQSYPFLVLLRRGAIVTTFIVCYALTSFISGYVSGGLYSRHGGNNYENCHTFSFVLNCNIRTRNLDIILC